MKKFLFLVILSLVGSQATKAQLGPGDTFFGQPIVHEFKFTFYYTSYWDSLIATHTGEYYIPCDVEIDGNLVIGAGVKTKGNSSFNGPSQKKSFKIDFNEFVSGQKYDGLKKLNLNNGFKDPSFLREKLCLDFMNYHHIPSPRCSYANVYLNGQLWGLYTVVEEVDDEFLERWFYEKKGNLFKGDPTGSLEWLGSSPSSYYTKYELHNNDSTNDWSDLVNLIDVINNTPLANLDNDLHAVFDYDEYAYYWAATALFVNLDSYMGSGHNYYLYHDSTEMKFRFIAWDVNEAFGNFSQGMTVTQLENLALTYIQTPVTSRPLHNRALQVPALKQTYYDAVCDLINMDFSIYNMEWLIDSLANVVRPHVYADPKKFYTNQNFEDNITSNVTAGGGPGGGTLPGIKSFLINRRNALVSELASNGCTVGIETQASVNDLHVYPNPFHDRIQIEGLSMAHSYTYTIHDLKGQLIQSGALSVSTSAVQLPQETPAGVYLLTLKNDTFELIVKKKLIKY